MAGSSFSLALVFRFILLLTFTLITPGCSDDGGDETIINSSPTPSPDSVGSVTGKVTDAVSGDPIEGALISVNVQGVTPSVDFITAGTDADGVYDIQGVPAGIRHITLSHDAYESLTSSVTIGDGGITEKDFTLLPGGTPTGSIEGQITDAVSGAPIEGVLVSVNVQGSFPTATAITAGTDADGFYAIQGIPTGVRPVTLTHGEYDTLTSSVTIHMEETTDKNFAMNPNMGNVIGTVTDLFTGLPLEGVIVAIGARTTVTGIDGTYLLTKLSAGAAKTIGAVKPGYANFSLANNIIVAGMDNTIDIQMTPAAMATIRGTVTDAYEGTPIEDAAVAIGTITTTSAADGTYTLINITVGSGKTITASKEGYQNYSLANYVVVAGDNVIDIPMTEVLPGMGSVSGQVLDSVTLQLIPGALVTVRTSNTVTVYSDVDGTYEIEGVREGTANVTATATGYSNFSGTVDVVEGATANYDIQMLTSNGYVAGRVVDSVSGLPVADVGIYIYTATTTLQGYATTDVNGYYSIWVPSGTAKIMSAVKTGYTTFTSPTFNVPAGQTTTRPNISLVPSP